MWIQYILHLSSFKPPSSSSMAQLIEESCTYCASLIRIGVNMFAFLGLEKSPLLQITDKYTSPIKNVIEREYENKGEELV